MNHIKEVAHSADSQLDLEEVQGEREERWVSLLHPASNVTQMQARVEAFRHATVQCRLA